MRGSAIVALFCSAGIAASALAAPVPQPPIGPTDEFNLAVNPTELPQGPTRTPLNGELGNPIPGGAQSVPLPGPALMGAAGLAGLLCIRRRWSDRRSA